MKTVLLQRAWEDERATLGMLTILEVTHNPIFTLENPLRVEDFDSRIPAGVYECVPYSGSKYKEVYLVQDVPGRTGILIHWGNFERDTLGCILVGEAANMQSGEPAVSASKIAFNRLVSHLGKEPFTLIVKDVADASNS
jgi:hypothetical protein